MDTPRLRLRRFARTDAPRIAEICGDFRVSRMCRVVPHPYSVADAEFFVDHICGGKDSSTYAVEQRVDRQSEACRLIGCISLDGVRPVGDDGGKSATLGFWYGVDSWGQGFATEAAAAVLQHAFLYEGFTQLESGLWLENLASAAVHAKLGFRESSRMQQLCVARGSELDAVRLLLLRSEWEARRVIPSPGAFTLLACFPHGLRETELRVVCDPTHDRACFAGDEAAIEVIWQRRVAAQPTLFNGAKFRFSHIVECGLLAQGGMHVSSAEVVAAAPEAFAAAAAATPLPAATSVSCPVPVSCTTLHLGLTDYRSFLGTNCGGNWSGLPPACLASPLGNAAIVKTADGCVVLLRRSDTVGEMPHTVVMPGGHPEPIAVGVSSLEEWKSDVGTAARMSDGTLSPRDAPPWDTVGDEMGGGMGSGGMGGSAAGGGAGGASWAMCVRHELYDAMLREVLEETGLPLESLGAPLCLGFSRRVLHYRPDIVFLVECSLHSRDVAETYVTVEGVHREESTSIQLVEQHELLRRVLDEEDPSLPMPGCHRGGLELYRRYLDSRLEARGGAPDQDPEHAKKRREKL